MPASKFTLRAVSIGLLALALPAVVGADPLPVHTATAQVAPRPTEAQRLAVADAVAGVFAAALPEVLTGTESHARVETLAPASLSCGEARCAGAIRTALGARGVVLVRMETVQRHRLRLAIEVVDRAGERLAHGEDEALIGSWEDAVALARVVAGPLAAQVHTAENPPTPTPAVTPPTPVATPVMVPPTRVEPPRPTPPIEATGESARRPAEAAVGAVLIGGGLTAAALGLVSVARDGSDTGEVVENGQRVYVAGARDYVLLGVGGAAVVAGVIVLIDGLRVRTEPSLRVRVGVVATPSAAGVSLSGVF